MSPFKMNNPGCPCCENCPCACYPFNGNLNNSSGFSPGPAQRLNANGVYQFNAGKYGSGLRVNYHATAGRNTLVVPHHECFSLAGGFSVWFWLYSDPTCDTGGDGTYNPGVDDVGVTSYLLSKGTALNQVADPPEWVIALPVNKRCDGSSNNQLAYGAGNANTGSGVQAALLDDANYEGNYSDPLGGGGTGPAAPSWEFYFMFYDPLVGANGTIYMSIDAAQWQATAFTFPVLIDDTKPLYILEQVGQQASYFIIDELGFCDDLPKVNAAGQTTYTQMRARATALYNLGAGAPCNNYK